MSNGIHPVLYVPAALFCVVAVLIDKWKKLNEWMETTGHDLLIHLGWLVVAALISLLIWFALHACYQNLKVRYERVMAWKQSLESRLEKMDTTIGSFDRDIYLLESKTRHLGKELEKAIAEIDVLKVPKIEPQLTVEALPEAARSTAEES